MAQALAESRSDGRVQARSAGSSPRPLHPNAVRVMREAGIDISSRRSRHLSVFAAESFDYVITLCDRVREVCPEFPGHPGYIHWSIPDPAASGGSDEQTYPVFRRVAADLETRIRYLLADLATGRPGSGDERFRDAAPEAPAAADVAAQPLALRGPLGTRRREGGRIAASGSEGRRPTSSCCANRPYSLVCTAIAVLTRILVRAISRWTTTRAQYGRSWSERASEPPGDLGHPSWMP